MPKYTVFFTYAVDGEVIVQARDEGEAIRITENSWNSHAEFENLSPKLTGSGDFEVLSVKKRPSTPADAALKSV